jgi:galactokinase
MTRWCTRSSTNAGDRARTSRTQAFAPGRATTLSSICGRSTSAGRTCSSSVIRSPRTTGARSSAAPSASCSVPGARRLAACSRRGSFPRGSGLSSSAALEVALALALLAHSGEPEPDRRELARLCSRVENHWVGATTGVLAQIAAVFRRPGQPSSSTRTASLLRRWRSTSATGGWRPSTPASRTRTRVPATTSDAASVSSRANSSASPRCATPTWRRPRLCDPLHRRVQHVVEEKERVERAVATLQRRDLAAMAELLDRRHASLRDLYEVSVPEVEATIERLMVGDAVGRGSSAAASAGPSSRSSR